MLTLAIGSDIEHRLEALGADTEERKLSLLRCALREALEDMEDVRMAEQILEDSRERYSLEEVEREFGLED